MEQEQDTTESIEESVNRIETNTVFTFSRFLPSQQSSKSVENESEWSKESESHLSECSLKIEHSNYTDIDSVGLQVWNGALLLSDYIIHSGNSLFRDKNVLELASGIGLVSIITSMYCTNVICTDINEPKILETIQKNIKNNEHLINAIISVKVFDFFNEWTSEIEEIIDKTDIILASEVIYDNQITDAFIEQLIKILNKNSKIAIYITMEKRYIFSVINLRVEAKHYDYFFERITAKEKIFKLDWKVKKMELDFPQYFHNYERNKDLELWRISKH